MALLVAPAALSGGVVLVAFVKLCAVSLDWAVYVCLTCWGGEVVDGDLLIDAGQYLGFFCSLCKCRGTIALSGGTL